MMNHGIISLGEVLIDFIPLDKENSRYLKSPGGAPANVAVGAAQLGSDTHFLGKAGQDSLGVFLQETLESYGVGTSLMTLTDEAKTGFTLVSHDEKGDRTFEFFIQPSADSLLRKEDINTDLFDAKKILHIGSISLIHEPVKSATWHAIHLAKEKGLLLSFDPNIRLSLWQDEEVARSTIKSILPYVDMIKLSDDELSFLMGEKSDQAIKRLAADYSIPLVFVTQGEKGSIAYSGQSIVEVPAMKVDAVDTTGAGDAFVSAILYQIDQLDKPLEQLTSTDLETMAKFANVSGGVTAATQGAMSALPTLETIANMGSHPLKG